MFGFVSHMQRWGLHHLCYGRYLDDDMLFVGRNTNEQARGVAVV